MRHLHQNGVAGLLRNRALQRLLPALNDAGEETRVVGGAVRNALLGHPVTEIDLATTAPPAEVTRRAEQAGLKAVPTGIEHGTVTVLVDGEPFEVTTLREDVETDGRRAVVRYGRDFAMDARRRDFTINALSIDAGGALHDYVGGLRDLETRRVRFIGDPITRIREDYLRILRFFRFHSEYGQGDLDPAGHAAAIRAQDGLGVLSPERVRIELLKFLATRRVVDVIGPMAASGILVRLLSGVAEQGRLARVVAFEAAHREPLDPVRRLAALAIATHEDADRLRERLRLSNHEHARLNAYAAVLPVLKDAPAMDALALRRLVVEHGLEAATDALAALTGEPRPQLQPEAVAAFEAFRSGAEPVPVFPLRGADLLAGGVPSGPHLGRLMAQARRRWLLEGCPVGEEARRRLLGPVLEEAGRRDS